MKIVISEKQLGLFKNGLLNEQTSSQVKEVQQKLNDCCKSGLSVDGIVGPATARAIKSCLGIDIINNTPIPDDTNVKSEGVQCLKDNGFKWQPSSKIGPFTIPGYYSKDNFKLNGKTYDYATAIESNSTNSGKSKGFNLRVNLGNNGPGLQVMYGNWSCTNGKFTASLSGDVVNKYPGDYGF